ncbi:UDP-N-acetylmuramoyl-tripeptide--D-alanyl-D-alanine ligase, partial [bacterium]|nr:UDP-N-acetylmuramoyl-tripeptide--D-alanyl-D-alanine ligase [bacterium]
VIPAGMFVALQGERVDGHDYVEQAFKKGAHLALIQHDIDFQCPVIDLRQGSLGPQMTIPVPPFVLRVEDTLKALQDIARYWRRKHDLHVIGITGSVGKSTTKELIAEVLGMRYRVLKNPGNLNNEIGLPLTLLHLSPGHQVAVLEMGFYVPGEITFLCDLALPQIGVITNVGTVHAERAGSQKTIAKGKAELVQALPPAPDGVAILNYDDPWVQPMAEQTRANVFYYGLDPRADLWADNIESLGLKGITFQIHFQNEVLHVRLPLIGRHSVHTALRAAAVGIVEGMPWSEIIAGLRQSHSQLRLVVVNTDKGALLVDDSYNASPESTLAALNLLEEIDGRKVAVLGDMLELGPYEAEGHEIVGRRAAQVANLLVTVGELGKLIGNAARESGLNDEAIINCDDVPQAIKLLQGLLVEGDVALIKGSHGLRMDRIAAALEVQE